MEKGGSGVSTLVPQRLLRKNNSKGMRNPESLQGERNASGNAKESKGQGVGNRDHGHCRRWDGPNWRWGHLPERWKSVTTGNQEEDGRTVWWG